MSDEERKPKKWPKQKPGQDADQDARKPGSAVRYTVPVQMM